MLTAATAAFTANEELALRDMVRAEDNGESIGCIRATAMAGGPAAVARRLIERGHAPIVAIRVACTPAILGTAPELADDSRPGLDLFVGLGLQFGRMAEILGRELLQREQGGAR
jgi:hypothetical protein